MYNLVEPVCSEMYKLACTSVKDSDQPAHLHSLIRVYDENSMGSQGFNNSLGYNLRLIRLRGCFVCFI